MKITPLWNFKMTEDYKLVADLDKKEMSAKIMRFQSQLLAHEESIILSHLSDEALTVLKNKVDSEIKNREKVATPFRCSCGREYSNPQHAAECGP
mgnify:CR=1 FL=1